MSWQPQDRAIYDPEFWAQRLAEAEASGNLHHAVFKTDRDTWAAINAKHAAILAKYIAPADSIFDAGCSWGRILDLMPDNWLGRYLGIDIANAFIKKARLNYPDFHFRVGDIRDLSEILGLYPRTFSWGLVVSVKRVIIGHSGQGVWDGIETQLRLLCRRLLILDYDPEDDGEVV